MGKPAAYHLLSIDEKRAQSIDSQRERAVACPSCDTQVMPVDMTNHLQRCEPREPGPLDRWVSARDPIVRRVPKQTRSDWVRNGLVRVRGDRMDREYLLRDLAKRIAFREGFRRR